MDLIKDAMKLLQQSGVKGIPPKWKPHKLSGNYSDNWECHVLPDLLIIWYQVDISGVITMVRAGTHSDLF
jgi:mRNA interferase YafQ